MSDTGQLQVRTRTEGQAVVVSPQGDVDLTGSPSLRAELKKVAASPKLVIDLSAVQYMDSSGVATLVEAMQTAKRNKTTIVLCALTDRVRSILHIARLDAFFAIKPDVEEALKA